MQIILLQYEQNATIVNVNNSDTKIFVYCENKHYYSVSILSNLEEKSKIIQKSDLPAFEPDELISIMRDEGNIGEEYIK